MDKVDPPELAGTLSGRSMVVAAKAQISADLADEVVILNLESGVYYGLDTVGAQIWSLIQEPRLVNDIRDVLLKEYEVEPDHCEHDLFALLNDLADHGLVEVNHETVE